jgi:hypothetical protein
MLQLYEDPLPSDSPNGALRDSIDKKNSLLKGLFSTPSSSSIIPPDAAPATAVGSEGTILNVKASQSPVDLGNSAIDDSSSGSLGSSAVGVDLDQASDLSRSPWRQSESPFTVTPSTATTTATAPKTSSEINMERKQKEKAGGKSATRKAVSTKDISENDNDVEWVVDAFNVDAPERTEAAVTGMSSSGRSVNRRRQQLQQPQAPAALSPQESRIMKARLDELRKAYGLYVSDGTNEAVEKKLIDQFK